MLVLADLALLLGLTLRLTRLVTTDDISEWWLRDPAEKWAIKHKKLVHVSRDNRTETYSTGWRGKLVSGLDCPFCIGFWLGLGAVISLDFVGGPGSASDRWRYTAGAFTLNYISAHVSARLD